MSSTKRSVRRPRGFTVAELVISMSVVAIVAAIALVSMSNASDTTKRSQKLKAVFAQFQQIRAKHLTTSGGPEACLQLKHTTSNQLEMEQRTDCLGGGAVTTKSLASAVILPEDVCIDSLGRGAKCASIQELRDITIEVEIDGRPPTDGRIVWGANGRLVASFGVDHSPEADAQAHLVDVSASVTPQPTATGTFGGSATNPAGLLQ